MTRLWPNFELTRLWQRIWPEMTKPWLVDRDYYYCSPCWTTWQSATNHNTELWEDSDQIMGTLWTNLDHLSTSTVDKMIDDGLKVLVLNWWKRLEVSLPLYHTRSTTTSWYTTRANLSSTWAKPNQQKYLSFYVKVSGVLKATREPRVSWNQMFHLLGFVNGPKLQYMGGQME